MKNLYLFDIDGILVNINRLHLQSYRQDYKDVLKLEVPDKVIISTFGMSDYEMHLKILGMLNLSATKELVRKLIAVHTKNFEDILISKQVKPLKGVVKLLKNLKKSKEYVFVITGNTKEHAELILKRAGLKFFFDYISYADGKSSRAKIVKNAVNMAVKKGYKFKNVIVIDDTHYGIRAGKCVHAFVIAVATGSESFNFLKKEKPDLLLNDLTQFKRIFNYVNELKYSEF
jgi:beta-phosphoglucomutase-like phosphatase (HAD superfamily)